MPTNPSHPGGPQPTDGPRPAGAPDPTDAPAATLLKAADAGGAVRWFVRTPGGLAALDDRWTLGSLLALPEAELRSVVDGATPVAADGLTLLAPLDDDTEVWASGVTYEISRSARMHESTEADIYDRVYDAERPELFFKAVGWRVSGPGGPVGVRSDSSWDVPEPELAVVCNAAGSIVGYTVCNDMSSRSIEGANPLYLPQAKIYRHSCAVGPWIRLADAVPDADALEISVSIVRDGATLWSASTSTGRLKRTPAELVTWLFRAEPYPRGVILATGTSAVPDDSVSAAPGDIVDMSIQSIGRLTTPVVSV